MKTGTREKRNRQKPSYLIGNKRMTGRPLRIHFIVFFWLLFLPLTVSAQGTIGIAVSPAMTGPPWSRSMALCFR